MRKGWLALLMLTACAQGDPLGSYRLPMPTGSQSVGLVTVLAREDEGFLILFDTAQGKELDRGKGDLSLFDSTEPFMFNVPEGAPFQLVTADSVMHDVAPRSYPTVPLIPLEQGAAFVRRITLTSGTDSLVLVSTGGALFAEAASAQPPTTDTPGPLFPMNSVAGAGLSLPTRFEETPNWHDAISNLIPPDPKMPIACAAPLISSSRTESMTGVDVPAGHFDATPVVEVIDTCQQANPPDLFVYRIDRWFTPGVGPVRMSYTDSSSRVHDYRLTAFHVTEAGNQRWPLKEGNSWTYEVRDGSGAVVLPSVTVTVTSNVIVKP